MSWDAMEATNIPKGNRSNLFPRKLGQLIGLRCEVLEIHLAVGMLW